MIAEKLRKSILQAAIQGKLTEQLPEDGDARELLAKIKAEKARLVKDGKIKKEKPLPVITEEEISFDIPENWCWVRLEQITTILGDGIHGTPKYDMAGEYRFINGNNLNDGRIEIKHDTKRVNRVEYQKYKKVLDETTVLVSINGTIGNVAFYNGEKVILGKSACYFNLIDNVSKYYVKLLLATDYFLKYAIGNATGSTIKNVSLKVMRQFIVPLPPISEQLRIVDSANQALVKIKDLEKDELKLQLLQKSFPKKMKDSLLQAAIKGKLTEQMEADGDARALVTDIQKEKTRLIEEGKIKKEKDLPEISEEEIPFEIPDNWCWVRLGDISQYIQRGKSPKYSTIKKYPVIAQKCIQWQGLQLEKAQFIDPETIAKYAEERMLQEEDLMWNSTGLGTLGRIGVYIEDKNVYGFAVADSHVTVIRTIKKLALPKYVFAYISGPYIQNIVEDISSGSTKQKELATDTVKKVIVPLPPIAEQYRIVERLEQLLPLCDALE